MTELKLTKLLELRRLQAEKQRRAAEAARKQARQWATPGDLARTLDPKTVQTRALDLIDSALVDVAEGRCLRLMISMPPQEGKSQRTSRRFPLWMLTRNPGLRIAIVSYAHGVARRWGRAIRDDIHDHGAALRLAVNPNSSAAHEWELDGHDGSVYCVGITGSLTSRPVDLLIIDDPYKNGEQADSEAWRETVRDFWTEVAIPRLGPGVAVVIIQTRWRDDDLSGWLQSQDEGERWRVLNIPAQADHDPNKGQVDPLGREPGEYMTSARGRTVADWEEKKLEVGSRAWNALYQGRPSPGSGNVWHRPWWRRYTVPLWSQHPTAPDAYRVDECDELVMSWDMAFKDTKSSDFVVGQVWARRGANVYLLDQIHKRLSFTDTVTAFTALAARWPQATAKYVEDKANGTAIIDTLKSKIPGIVAVTPKESKYARANAVAPVVQAGNVFLPAAEIALFDPEELIDEAASFPNGAHDDQVDATSQALAQLLLDGTGAQAWIDYARRKAEAVAAANAEADSGDAPADLGATEPEPATDLEDPVAARKRARDAAHRQHRM